MGKNLKSLSPPPNSERWEESYPDFDSVVDKVEAQSQFTKDVDATKLLVKSMQSNVAEIRNVINEARSLKTTIDGYLSTINALNKTVANSVKGFETAIDRAHKTVVTAQLSPMYIQQLEAYKQYATNSCKEYMDNLRRIERNETSRHYQKLEDMMQNNDGVWLSYRVFRYWVIATGVMFCILIVGLGLWICSIIK